MALTGQINEMQGSLDLQNVCTSYLCMILALISMNDGINAVFYSFIFQVCIRLREITKYGFGHLFCILD